MTHKILIAALPDGFTPAEGMRTFNIHLQRRMPLGPKNAPRLPLVGLHFAGYFSFTGDAAAADDAVKYGLRQAVMALGNPRKVDFAALFGKRADELVPAANEALTLSESPVRIDAVVFGFVEYCIPDTEAAPRYEGIIIGKTASHRVASYKPAGIAGEWQCVCGAYNPPGSCTSCGLERPGIPFLQS